HRLDNLSLHDAHPITFAGAGQTNGPYTVRKRLTGGLRNPVISETFFNAVNLTEGPDGDRWYIANGVDPIWAWDGESDSMYAPDLDRTSTRLTSSHVSI